MVTKQSSVNLSAVDKEVADVQLSGQVEGVALEGGVLDDVHLGQRGMAGRVEAGPSTEATVGAKNTSAENVAA